MAKADLRVVGEIYRVFPDLEKDYAPLEDFQRRVDDWDKPTTAEPSYLLTASR